jgi:O-antigen/teichoic acid export membrane protein
MESVKKSTISNFIGTFWSFAISIIFIPVYVKLLGVESWGIIGVFTSLQAVMVIFDMGLSAAMTREMARLTTNENNSESIKNLVRTLEIIYIGIALFIFALIYCVSHFISHTWLNGSTLDPLVIEKVIVLMGSAAALQFPSSLYSGGLIGLQKQVLLNGIGITINTIRGFGTVLVLMNVSATIEAFFICQAIVSVLNSIVLHIALWKNVPLSMVKAKFKKEVLLNVWKFAAGMSAISILALILTQIDKVILSKTLSLLDFGYYTFASTLVLSLSRLYSPYFYSIYPRLTQLVDVRDDNGLITFYHKSCQFMAFLIIPVALVLSFFSFDIVFLWTKSIDLTNNTHNLISVLIIGTLFNGLMNPPYALQLAYGWTKLNFYSNVIATLIMIPCYFFLSQNYGSLGASFSWVILNLGYILFLIPVMHKKILQKNITKWYLKDLVFPFIVGIIVVFSLKISFGAIFTSDPGKILSIGVTLLIAYFAVGISMRYTREIVFNLLKNIKYKI